MLQRTPIAPGFSEPVYDAQRVFRSLMGAMSRPGSLHPVDGGLAPLEPLSPASAAIALTLADFETPIWLGGLMAGTDRIADWIRFHTGARIVDRPEEAAFGFAAGFDDLPELCLFGRGSQEYPDASATLIVQVTGFADTNGRVLTGPGIEDQSPLAPDGVTDLFWQNATANSDLFPRGIDFVFAAPGQIAALPRSTRINPET